MLSSSLNLPLLLLVILFNGYTTSNGFNIKYNANLPRRDTMDDAMNRSPRKHSIPFPPTPPSIPFILDKHKSQFIKIKNTIIDNNNNENKNRKRGYEDFRPSSSSSSTTEGVTTHHDDVQRLLKLEHQLEKFVITDKKKEEKQEEGQRDRTGNDHDSIQRRPRRSWKIVTSSSYYPDRTDGLLKEAITNIFIGALLGMIVSSILLTIHPSSEFTATIKGVIDTSIMTITIGGIVGGILSYKAITQNNVISRQASIEVLSMIHSKISQFVLSTSKIVSNPSIRKQFIQKAKRNIQSYPNYMFRNLKNDKYIKKSRIIDLKEDIQLNSSSSIDSSQGTTVREKTNELQNSFGKSHKNEILHLLSQNIIKKIKKLPEDIVKNLKENTNTLFPLQQQQQQEKQGKKQSFTSSMTTTTNTRRRNQYNRHNYLLATIMFFFSQGEKD